MDKSPPPIFIVGAPRSGTTLLAAMFGAHPCYAAGPETQFFVKIKMSDLRAAAKDPAWPDLAMKLLPQLTTAGQSAFDLFETNAGQVKAYLSQREPSISAMLESLVQPFADRRGKPGWVEKTPHHLEKLSEIREVYPEARIVRIVRDPRDAATSTARLPTFSDSIVANAYLWREWFDASERVLCDDEFSATLRYEDLVASPEAELQRLCEGISIPYSPDMLQYQSAAQDVSSKSETWKKQVSGALDPSRCYSWKSNMDARTADLIGMICHEWVERFGYDRGADFDQTHLVYNMSPGFVEEFEDVLFHDAQRGVRWLGTFDLNEAEHVFDHPRYYRFGNPLKLARLAMGRAYARRRRREVQRSEVLA